MAAIQQGRSPVVAIMPTGGGKSMLFMLPAWAVPGGTTIVVDECHIIMNAQKDFRPQMA
jgi:superfamily II DNA helicase RecQ